MIFKKEISIIGLGFIGFPLFSFLNSKLKSKVIGIDKKNLLIKNKFLQIKKGINPIKCNDEIFNKIVKKNSRKKLYLSTDLSDIKNSKIVIVSVGFDLSKKNSMHNLKKLFDQNPMYKTRGIENLKDLKEQFQENTVKNDLIVIRLLASVFKDEDR